MSIATKNKLILWLTVFAFVVVFVEPRLVWITLAMYFGFVYALRRREV